MGPKAAGNFLSAIDAAKTGATLARLISALGIRHVGERTAKTLAQAFPDMDSLMAVALVEPEADPLLDLPDIGPAVAASIRAFFHSPANQALLADLKCLGLWPRGQSGRGLGANGPNGPAQASGPLAGKKFVFTGGLPDLSRPQAQALVEEAGGEVLGSVSKKTDYVVAGAEAGSKLDKARALGLTILDQAGFLELLRSGGPTEFPQTSNQDKDRS